MKKLILLYILWTIPLLIRAISIPELRFRHFSVENGLSSNTVRALLQDKYGFIWIGTDEGLNRYDGTSIKSYRYNSKIHGGPVLSLFESDEGLWVGTDWGLYVYNHSTEMFTYNDVSTSEKVRITTTINNITQDRDGNLWISTSKQGVFRYDVKRGQLVQYQITTSFGFIPYVFVDSDNQIWAVSNQGRSNVYRLHKVENRFVPAALHYKDKKEDSRSLVIFEDSEHFLWLGTWECGLQKIDKHTGIVTTYLHPATGNGSMHIHSIMEYLPHKLLIGSDDGLGLFDSVTGEYKLFTNDETNPYSLSNRFVYPMIKDKEGGIWIGTYYGGVNYISPNTGQFENYNYSEFTNSVGGHVIGRFCEDSKGHIWIASDDGGLSCFLPESRLFSCYMPKGINSLSYHNVHALCLDGDNLWVGTYTGGVNVLNMHTGIFKWYTFHDDDPHSLDGTSSYAIFKDKEKRIWVASMSGLNLYNAREDNFIRIKEFGGLTIDIDQDTKGYLWFATQGKGLFKYDPKRCTWKNYLHDDTSGSLPDNQVNCTMVDTEGQVWVGTMSGLCKYNPGKDNFEFVELNIPSRNIYCIIEDQHVLWLTTTKGLVRYTPGEGCKVFTKSDGLTSDQFLPNSGLKASDGKIYIGSVDGFNTFYPYLIKTNSMPPPVVITGIEIFNKEIKVGDELLPKSLNDIKQLDLSYKDNVFGIRFASLSYSIPQKNQYAYKLEGFDKDWNYVGSQSKATYTNLPTGRYVFRVKATNNDGVWNNRGAGLIIVVHPPFYLSTTFIVLYVVLSIIALVFLVRFILKRIEKRHAAEIDKLNENKEKEMHEAKIHFFTMIAHEIRTPVSLIIGPLEKIMKSSLSLGQVYDDLNIIDRNSRRLLFLVNQLLDFRKVEQEGWNIRLSCHNIYDLLESIGERFEPSFRQHNIRFQVEYPDKDFTAMVDSESIIKLVSNLLTNARKYAKDEVTLSCKVQNEQHTFVIAVSDNGTGIRSEEQTKIFEPFYQASGHQQGTGIGLSIVKGIVNAHHGSIEVVSKLNEGTSFIVTLPTYQPDTYVSDVMVPAVDDTMVQEEDTLIGREAVKTAVKDKPVMLIVDDNREFLTFLSGCFADRYGILTAGNGLEALDFLEKHAVSLIVSDWMMPVMDGVAFCKSVRANKLISHIPFILLTAKTDVDSKVEGLDCGADIYIEKPFSIQYLEACAKGLLDIRNMLREKFSKMPFVPLNSMAANSSDREFLDKMNEIIEQNISSSALSVDYLAENLCISRSGLFAKIKTLLGETPNELIQLMRLKRAAVLLSENKYRINEICYMVGFNNPSYFAKCFQKQFGIKPGDFLTEKCYDGK